ncbi:MAG: motility associated factor glycosyltransferase family protein [Parachlamydiales bacterium]
MIHTSPLAENLSLLSEKAPDVAWKLGEGEGLPPWPPIEVEEEVVFAIGVAEGLNPGDHHLVLCDFEGSPIRAFLETEAATDLLSHPKVHVTLLQAEVDYQLLQGRFGGLSAQVEIHPAYANHQRAKKAKERLLSDSHAAFCTLQELTHFPDLAVRHILENLEAKSQHAASLFGKFPKVPAVICGAGPSLNVAELKKLKGEVVIFAPGSALKALLHGGVTPDFAVSLDPFPTQMERLVECEVPMLYTGRWLPEARRAYKGPLLYVSGTEHPLSRWLDRERGIGQEPVWEGTCALHLATDLARLMGCDPIAFVGMDLAYTGGELYAEGVGDTRTLATRRAADGVVQRSDGTWTQWKWIDERSLLDDYIDSHPDVTFCDTLPVERKPFQIPAAEGLPSAPHLAPLFWESLARCEGHLLALLDSPTAGMRALHEVELEEEIAYKTYLERSLQALKTRELSEQERLVRMLAWTHFKKTSSS